MFWYWIERTLNCKFNKSFNPLLLQFKLKSNLNTLKSSFFIIFSNVRNLFEPIFCKFTRFVRQRKRNETCALGVCEQHHSELLVFNSNGDSIRWQSLNKAVFNVCCKSCVTPVYTHGRANKQKVTSGLWFIYLFKFTI